MWKPQNNTRSVFRRIEIAIPKFRQIKRLLNYYPTWKILLALLSSLLIIQSINLTYNNRRYKPQNINYDDFDALRSLDEQFEPKILKKFPVSDRPFKSKIDDVFQYGCRDPLAEAEQNKRENAAFVVLARNSEIDGVILSMRSLERRFNQWFNYHWVFLNEEPFTAEFKKRTAEVASGDLQFGVIPKKKWNFKEQTSKVESIFFNEVVENQGDRGIMYGNMHSYHSMCRFYSGFFFEHPLVKDLDWYWRVEPEVDFYCDLTYDPFVEMKKHNKKYGYTIIIKELLDTVPSLFKHTKTFIRQNNINLPDSWNLFANNFKFFKGKNENLYLNNELSFSEFFNTLEYYAKLSYARNHPQDKNSIDFVVQNALAKRKTNSPGTPNIIEKIDNESYNLCHFWSNFEIASNALFTSPQYKAYYEYLENSKGFYTERWGDAPIHSLAVGMFLNLDEIHYFRDIGYKHSTIAHCPFNSPNQLPYEAGPKFKHQVLPKDEVLYANYDQPMSHTKAGASGCRCRCPSDHSEIENSQGSCSTLWLKLTNDDFNDKNSEGVLALNLGTKKWLDLDTLEELALNSFEKWLNKGNEWDKWSLTEEEMKEFKKNVITASN